MSEVELEMENMGITLDPVEWYRTIIDGKVNANTPTHSFVPDGVVNYLGPVFQGYMMGPTAVYENQPLTAKTRIVHDLEEFRTTIADLERPAFLYMPMYIPTQPLFRKVDEEGEFVELDPPEILEGAWRIRYSVLGEL